MNYGQSLEFSSMTGTARESRKQKLDQGAQDLRLCYSQSTHALSFLVSVIRSEAHSTCFDS